MEPHKSWIDQCDAAVRIERDFGTEQALRYLVGEKYLDFLEAAESDTTFRNEVPEFTAKVKSLFEQVHLNKFLRMARDYRGSRDDNSTEDGTNGEDSVEDPSRAKNLLLVGRAESLLLDQ